MSVVIPVGAMLPDIDHNNSKLGRTRKKLVEKSFKYILVAVISFIVIFTFLRSTNILSQDASIKMFFILTSFLFILFLLKNKTLKKKFKFFTKHRGIMHTLLIPVYLLILSFAVFKNIIIHYLLLGLAIGYLTHLAGDCLTKAGCPILYPFTQKNISFSNITTNTAAEKFMAVLLCVGITVVCSIYYMLLK